jgi:hypothetical protein
VRLASVRRSLFSSEPERTNFLSRLVNGTRDILRAQVRRKPGEACASPFQPGNRVLLLLIEKARVDKDKDRKYRLAGLFFYGLIRTKTRSLG